MDSFRKVGIQYRLERLVIFMIPIIQARRSIAFVKKQIVQYRNRYQFYGTVKHR